MGRSFFNETRHIMKIHHFTLTLATVLFAGVLHAQPVNPASAANPLLAPKPVDTTPKLAYGLMMKQGEKTIFAPCRDQSYAFMQDVSTDQFVTKALNMVGLDSGKKLYVELLGIIEGGTLKASGINMAKTEGRCQLPGTKEEAWRASGNEPGWVLAAGGQMVSFKQSEKPGLNLPYTPFKREGKLALFEGATEAGKLSVRLENTLCRDTMADAVFNWTATVTANGQTYKGCAWER